MPVGRVQDTPRLRQRNQVAQAMQQAKANDIDNLRDRLALSRDYYEKRNPEAKKPEPKKPEVKKPEAKKAEPQVKPSENQAQKLKNLSTEELATLGRTNKAAFFAALRPAAEEAEKKYNVPAEVTLAQAALESGWGKSALGGYNIFGIKGSGNAGSIASRTQEWIKGQYVTITAKFAKYSDFYEAVVAHGKLFHNGYYDKAVQQYSKDRNYQNFIKNIQGIYATDPHYSSKLTSIINEYHLAA